VGVSGGIKRGRGGVIIITISFTINKVTRNA